MAKKRPAPRSAEQIKRDTARLHAVKGHAMRDMKALHEAHHGAGKKRGKPAGIHMGAK